MTGWKGVRRELRGTRRLAMRQCREIGLEWQIGRKKLSLVVEEIVELRQLKVSNDSWLTRALLCRNVRNLLFTWLDKPGAQKFGFDFILRGLRLLNCSATQWWRRLNIHFKLELLRFEEGGSAGCWLVFVWICDVTHRFNYHIFVWL